MTLFRKSGLFLLICAVLAGIPLFAQAQKDSSPTLIRDTEIENILKEWMQPMLQSAGIDHVNIILVQDSKVNAFVAGGPNIFLYTGLIQKTKDPGELLGVMGHELGHISGGHLIAARVAMERASYESIIGSIIGVGAAAASGDGAAGSAISLGSKNMAMRRYLTHSRVNESSADQAALRFFQGAQMNPSGLVSFFGTLESEELLPMDQQSEYMLTHPLTRNRMDAVRMSAEKSPYYAQAWPAKMIDQHARIKAKLMGFINPNSVPWTYNDNDESTSALYAKAIAAYRTSKLENALDLIDQLLEKEPENPYFLELKGQMLMDYGRIADSLPYYRKSAQIAPNPALIEVALARALLEMPFTPALADEAIDNLKKAEKDEARSTMLHRLLATAYGKLGDDVQARLELAEEAVLQKRYDYARTQAEFVAANAKAGGAIQLQARDILAYLDQKKPD